MAKALSPHRADAAIESEPAATIVGTSQTGGAMVSFSADRMKVDAIVSRQPAEFRRDGQAVGPVGKYIRGGARRIAGIDGPVFFLRFEGSRRTGFYEAATEVAFQVRPTHVRVYRLLSIDLTVGVALVAATRIATETKPLKEHP